MGKKKDKLAKRLWDMLEVQAWRIKKLMSIFYPNGVVVDFEEAPRVGKSLIDSQLPKRLMESVNHRRECLEIIADAREEKSSSIDIDFFHTEMRFDSKLYVDYEARIMFKANPEDIPVYVKQGYEDDGIMLRFLVINDIQRERKDAYLVLTDLDAKKRELIHGAELDVKVSSFIELWELHAIIVVYDPSVPYDEQRFYVSFSRDDGRCVIEEIYIDNMGLTKNLIRFYDPDIDDSGASPTEDQENE